ncbi:MAG: M23 family metallopeptidase [Actinomycetota bacterium]|nr:M23 family metallopeptidase [Actinomycetota bacterium]
MRPRRALAPLLLLVAFLGPTSSRAAAGLEVQPGMVFPVQRSSWYSVINLSDDWHAPRMRFIGGRWRQVGVHEGNDIYAEPGTPIRAVLGGTIEQVGWTFYSGWRVGVRGSDGRYWFYAHMSDFAPGITVGRRVAAGAVLGRVGNTGYGEDPGHNDEFTYHLHLGVQDPGGAWLNPYPLMRALYADATASAP